MEASLNLISHNRERFDKKIIAASKSKAPVTFADFENRRDENIFLIRDIDKKIKAELYSATLRCFSGQIPSQDSL